MGGASRGTPGPQKNTVQIISSKNTKDAELILSSRLHTASDEIKSNSGSLVMSPHSDTIVKQKLSFPEKSGSIDQVLKVNSVSESDTNNLTLDWSYPGVEQYSTGTITFKVTVATKTSAHRYHNIEGASPSGYLIDGKPSPYIDMIPGKTYRFDQSDSTNTNHPIKFYTTATKDSGTEYTTGVKRFSSGSDNYTNYDPPGTGTEAYVEIVVSDSTPALLFYQCQSHGLMGNQIQVKGVGVSGGGSALTIQDEGSALSTAATTLNFVGDGVTASGTGAEKTITISGGGGGSDTNTTYTQSWQDSGDNAILRLTAGGSGSGNNDLTLVAGNNITLTPDNNNTELTIASSGGGGGTSLPSQTGNADKFLKTDGSSLTWATPSGGSGSGSSDFKGLTDTPNTMTAADAGKIVTVNGTGDALEYGANFRELAFDQTIIRTAKKIEGLAERWLDLSSHNTSISDFNTDVSVNVAQGSRVKINCLTGVSTVGGNGIISFRLGKKVDGNVVWGSTNGVLTTRNDYQTDPKGDNEYSNKSENIGQNRIECWDFIHNEAGHLLYCVEPHFVDTNPTNGLSGTHTVTYFLRVRCEYPNSGMTNDDFFINQDASGVTENQDRETCATILSVEELGSGAITSFTQEQALAGAGGTAAFTSYGLFNGSGTNRADTVVTTTGLYGYYSTGTMNDKLHNNILAGGDEVALRHNGVFPVAFAYEFTTPQIITKYRLWGGNVAADKLPKTWELRGADKATYISNDTTTYTILDSQVNVTTYTSSSSSEAASDNLNKANEYNLSTIGAYKYYVLHITNNNGQTYSVSISEWALYGGGFTIPSQVGHSGKILKTNGTSLKWEAPVDALLPAPQAADKGKIITVNSAGDDLEYGANFRELAYKQTFLTEHQAIIESDHEKWFDLSSHQSDSDWQTLNTDTTVNVGNGSKVMINISLYIGSDGYGDHHYFFRLGKKINNTVVWGSSNGISTNNNDNQTDPKGVSSDNATEAFMYSLDYDEKEQYGINEVTGHFVDENPTNGQSGTHNVTYFIRFRLEYPEGTGGTIGYIGRTFDGANSLNRQRMPTIVTVQELGLGAITSFTQEQALAGAGGTAAFTASTTAHAGHETLTSLHDNNTANNSFGIYFTLNFNTVSTTEVAYEFDTPQIITKYKMWPRANTPSGDRQQNPKAWEFRAAVDSATYNSGNGTYKVLDSQSLSGDDTEAGAKIGWKIDALIAAHGAGNTLASNLTHLANEYTLSTIGAYKYYVLHFTDNYGDNHIALAEWALYGGGFTIPSQVGHTGRLLTTDGTSLGWSTTSALPSVTVPEPTSTNKGRALVSTGTGIEFSDFNSGVSTGFKVYKSGTSFEEVTAGNAVLFDQTTTNVGAGSYSTTAGTYTVPVTGYYNIFANFTLPTVIWQGLSTTNNTVYLGDTIFTAYNNPNMSTADYIGYDFVNETNGAFNASTGIFTCQIKGRYRINAAIVMGNTSGGRRILYLYKNGSNFLQIVDTLSNYDDVGREVIVDLDVDDKIYLRKHPSYPVECCTFSGELIKTLNYRIQKSTNSGTTYTDLVTSSDKPTTSIVESLNQNDLIRVISGDGSTGSILNLQQGTTKNSFGAHLLNSGNSTSPIPIYGFFVEKSNNGGSSVITTSGTDTTISGWNIDGTNHFILPSSNFDLTNGVYTIPLSGYYQVTATIRTTRGDGSRINISVNNQNTGQSLHIQTYQVTDQQDTWSLNGILKLNTNDTIRIKIQASDFQYNADDTHWSCFLLASDTQTNTRQMGLSSIVPLHQLGHDQFADGTLTRFFISQGIDPQNLRNYRTADSTQNVVPNSTQSINSTFTSSTLYYNYNGTNYTTVPASPYSSLSSPNWDYQDYIYLQPILNTNAYALTYTCGSFTIDTSKILENYTGLWALRYTNHEGIRFKINGETFWNDSDPDGSTTTFGLYQKYINVEYIIYDGGQTENLIFQFHQTKADNHIQIAEPVMPSITLPTPNSVNSGKVLVSNGSGYALQPHSGYVPVYGFFVEKSGDTNSTANGTIGNWNKNGSNHFTLPSNNYNLTTGVYTIPVSGYYQVNATIRVNNNAGNRVYVSVNNDTSTSGANITLSNFQDTNDKEAWSLNGVLKLNINDTIELKVQYSGLNIDHDDTHWSCMLLNTTEVNATPSINIPLPVAAHAGKSLTVNSQGTGLEYGDTGTIKEYISGYCDGHTVSLKSGGTLTFENVTVVQHLDTTNKDLTGSTVSYLPPSGTTLVVYELIYNVSHPNDSNAMITSSRFYIDGVEQTGVKLGNQGYRFSDRVIMKVPIRITGTSDDPANVTVSSWNTSKTLKIKIKEWSSNWQGTAHAPRWFDGQSSESSQLNRPSLTIIAK